MRNGLRGSLVTAALAAAALAGCGGGKPRPKFLLEKPAGSWAEVPAAPAWVEAPPRREGWLRFTGTGRSNLHSLVFGSGGPSAGEEAEVFVRGRLVQVAGKEEAGKAATAASAGLVLLERACREEVLTTDPVPGNTLCTGWALWEVPLETVVGALPEAVRAEARVALAQ